MTGLIVFGLLFFIIVNGSICNWKNLNITGVIIKSTKYDDPSNKERYSTVYIIRDNNGNKTQYEAGNDDFSEAYYSTVSDVSLAVMLIGLLGSIFTLALIIKKARG